jgi:hypothetical protein
MAYDKTKDPFGDYPAGLKGFGGVALPVAPSDANDLATYAKSLVVTTTGNLVVLPAMNDDAVTVTFNDCPVGMTVPFRVRRVLATGTTASVAALF